MASPPITSTADNYTKNRDVIRSIKGSTASEQDIRSVIGHFHILFAFVLQTGFMKEKDFNDVLKEVLETLKLPNVEKKCEVSLITDFINNHSYDVGALGGGYVLFFNKDVSGDMVVPVSYQDAVKVVEHCAKIIVCDRIKDHCQDHGDIFCQLCKNEDLIKRMVITSPLVEEEEDLNVSDETTETAQENFMTIGDSLDHTTSETSKINSSVCFKCLQELSETDEESVGSDDSGCKRAISQSGAHWENDLNNDQRTVADSSSDSDVEFVRVASQETCKDFPKYKEEMLRKDKIFSKYWCNNKVTKVDEGANYALIYHVVKEDDIKHKLFKSLEDGRKWASENIHLMEENYPFILERKLEGAPHSSNVGMDTPKFSVVIKDPSNRLDPLEVQAAVDTGADDGTMGFIPKRVIGRLTSAQMIEHELKPVVFCNMNVEGQDIENICVLDVDRDSNWNALGERELKAVSEDTRRNMLNRLC